VIYAVLVEDALVIALPKIAPAFFRRYGDRVRAECDDPQDVDCVVGAIPARGHSGNRPSASPRYRARFRRGSAARARYS
jgi:hypothetical protein